MAKVFFIGAGPGDPELITIKGKKVPLLKVPAGMSGPNASKIIDADYVEALDAEEDFTLENNQNKIFDEENLYMDESNRFIDY